MKKLTENLRQNWPTYFFEILVLIIGIYGAFALESWNEERKDRKLEHKYLKALLIDLNRDVEQLENLKKVRQASNVTALRLLNTERIEASYEAQTQWTDDIIKVSFWHEFVPNDNTFKELSNSGNLSLFDNDSVKIGLLNLESLNDEIVTSRDHMRREYDEYLYDEMVNFDELPLLDYGHMVRTGRMEIKYIESLSQPELERLTELSNKMLKNGKIRNSWKLSILNTAYLINLYDQMIDEINQTTQHINNSLDNL